MNYTNKVYESQYLTLTYQMESNILTRHWKAQSQYMKVEEFKNEMLTLLESIQEHRPTLLLGDTYNFHFVILLDVQEWCDNNIYSKFTEFGVKKMAMVNSLDYYANLSVEQAITESPKTYEVQYFDNKEKALIWLRT